MLRHGAVHWDGCTVVGILQRPPRKFRRPQYGTLLDVVGGLYTIRNRTEFALINQRQSSNFGFQTFGAEQ